MTVLSGWTPLGCGFDLAGASEANPNLWPPFPADLVSRAEVLELGPESVYLAWELALLAGKETGGAQQRAIILLALAALAAAAGGSSRLPLEGGDSYERILAALGATAADRSAINQLLDLFGSGRGGDPENGLFAVFGGANDYRPLIIDRGCLYIQKLHALEAGVGEALYTLICAPVEAESSEAAERALAEVFASPPRGPHGLIALDSGQKKAVSSVLNGRITVISGRPGSGKTSIVANLLRLVTRIGEPPLEAVALAAPTGKAADRMRRSISNHLSAISSSEKADRKLSDSCPPSSTLHRLLGYSPGNDFFWHNENNPLAEKLVIVDESSMIDLYMMDRLLKALRPEARLVLLGDADQLPPIESGTVLRDLCRSRAARKHNRVIVLERSYRARAENPDGKMIIETAAAINRGEDPVGAIEGIKPLIRNRVSELNFNGVEFLMPGTDEQRNAFFSAWRDRLQGTLEAFQEKLLYEYRSGPSGFDEDTSAALRAVIGHFEKFRILCATRIRAGGTGSAEVNRWFHRRRFGDLEKTGTKSENKPFLVGEPVLVTRNDYNLRLYNGDSGLILLVKAGSGTRGLPAEPMAVFPQGEGYVAFPLEALRGKLELAWATTVHKAQGSEYDHVAIMLPRIETRPLTRELLYTAVTRARRSVVLIGPQEVLSGGIRQEAERSSGLAEILQ